MSDLRAIMPKHGGPGKTVFVTLAREDSPRMRVGFAPMMQDIPDHRADLRFVIYEQNRLRSRLHGSLAVLSPRCGSSHPSWGKSIASGMPPARRALSARVVGVQALR